MTIFLLLLPLLGLSGFLFLLVRHDIPPRIALQRIRNRFATRPPALLPDFHDVPYRLLNGRVPLHWPVLLNLQTSEGTGQACHPDVVFIRQGFGSQLWRYWMVCTPYAYGNFVSENPEVFASHDGLTWTIPEGAKNPLVPSPVGIWDHHSDPDMLFVDGKLWLYYRETRQSSGPPELRIFLMTSEDGVNWTRPCEVLVERGEADRFLSPAIVHDGMSFRMWSVEKVSSEFQLVQRNSADGLAWSSAEASKVLGLPRDRNPWHLDVIREADRLSAILVSAKGHTGQRLHYSYSVDEGRTWHVEPFLFEPAYEFESGFQYRSTLLKTGSQPEQYQVWYSAASRRLAFSIGYLRMCRENNRLQPILR
jgi:hypothetical protein